MSEEYRQAIEQAFGEPQRAARVAKMFNEIQDTEGLEHLNEWPPDKLADKLKSFANGGSPETGWNRWAAIQDGSGVDTTKYKF